MSKKIRKKGKRIKPCKPNINKKMQARIHIFVLRRESGIKRRQKKRNCFMILICFPRHSAFPAGMSFECSKSVVYFPCQTFLPRVRCSCKERIGCAVFVSSRSCLTDFKHFFCGINSVCLETFLFTFTLCYKLKLKYTTGEVAAPRKRLQHERMA